MKLSNILCKHRGETWRKPKRSEQQKPRQKQIRKIRQLLFNSQQPHTNYAFHFLFLCGKENRKIISNFILNEKAFGNSNKNNQGKHANYAHLGIMKGSPDRAGNLARSIKPFWESCITEKRLQS